MHHCDVNFYISLCTTTGMLIQDLKVVERPHQLNSLKKFRMDPHHDNQMKIQEGTSGDFTYGVELYMTCSLGGKLPYY